MNGGSMNTNGAGPAQSKAGDSGPKPSGGRSRRFAPWI